MSLFYCGRCGVGRTAVRGASCFRCRHPICCVARETIEELNEIVRQEGVMVVSAVRRIDADHPIFDTGGRTFYELDYYPTLRPELL